MQNFARFTHAFQPGDVFVRTDAVTAVTECHYPNSPTTPRVTVIGTLGNGRISVKESPAQVIEALLASEPPGVVSIEVMVPDGDTSSLADDCACHCGITCCDDEPDAADYALALKEAQDDAKIADERAEWYRKLAETATGMYSATVNENTRLRQQLAAAKDATAGAIATERSAHSLQMAALNNEKQKAEDNAAYYKQIADSRFERLGKALSESANLRDERDQLLVKLKDTTAALEKANAELAAIPRDANAAHNAFINSIKSKLAEPGLYGYTKN